MTRHTLPLALLFLAACAGSDAAPADDAAATAQAAAESAGAPSAAEVTQAAEMGEADMGGTFQVSLTGAITADADSRDATFCAQETAGMKIFTLSLVDATYAVSIAAQGGMPAVGSVKVSPSILEDYTATVIDKSAGTGTAQKQFEAQSGTVAFESVSAEKVTGTFEVSATPSYPSTGGAPVNARGRFEATPAPACDRG